MTRYLLTVLLTVLRIALGTLALYDSSPAPAAAEDELDRTVLPIQEPKPLLYTELDARNATPPPRFEVKAPEGAPNVLVILIDDMGFGQSSAFGGPIHMPTVEALANEGLRFNQFHTTALCSPTRTALLSGRNHHMNNMGGITEIATAFPGNTGQIPNDVAPVAEMLRLNGYSTAMFGKNHNTAAWEVSVSGPTDRWPTRQGFDKFYGFMGGETNQWAPLVYDGTSQVEVPHDPKYHFMTDMTNQAIKWVKAQKSLTPERPFFIYFAPGATHAPHHVPKEWIEKYRGKFDQGWDKVREETLARQKALGVVPADTPLAPKPAFIKDWDTLSADEKRLFARQMEVFAGFGEYADTEIGRLIAAIRDVGQLDNTLVFYIVGDNGASAEGGANGLFNENSYFNGVQESLQDTLKHIDELGGPLTYNHYAAGWAVAGDAPFTWTKQVASSYGGTRNPLVMYWPKRIKGHGEVRSQWHHVIDVAPTILEAAGLPEPKIVDGTPQTPIQGVSMLYAVEDPKAPDRHLTQYFEIAGNRAMYNDGWLAGTVHREPWNFKPSHTLQTDVWELYNTSKDFSLVNDVASKQPEKLKEMQELFMRVASENHVLPIDDRSIERMNPAIAGRPDLMAGRTTLTVYPGMTGMSENTFINTKNQSHNITADVVVPKNGAEGVLLAQGGRFGGWALYVKDGKPVYTYNWLGLKRYDVVSQTKLAPGKNTIRFDFAYDGGGAGKGGLGAILVNGRKVAEGRIDQTLCCLLSLDETADVGRNDGTPVTESYKVPFPFNGTIDKVTIDLGETSEAERAASDLVRRENRAKKALAD
jgi:arylsulfatase A-like enzyme